MSAPLRITTPANGWQPGRSAATWRLAIACLFQGHDVTVLEHIHKVPDHKYCLRCDRSWKRDGCAVYGCEK